MNAFDTLDPETLVQIAALQGAQEAEYAPDFSESYDDYDDEDSFYDDDDDESYYDDDEEEAFFEPDGFDSYDDFDDDETVGAESAEFFRRRRRRRLRTRRRSWKGRTNPRLRRVKGTKSTVLRGANGQAMRVRFGSSLAKATDVNKLIKSTEKKFHDAQTLSRKNHDALAAQVARNSKTLNARVKTVNDRVKKLESSAQTSQLLSLLNSGPKIKSIQLKGESEKAVEDIEYKTDTMNMVLPLLLGSGGGGDNGTMIAMAMMMANQNKD